MAEMQPLLGAISPAAGHGDPYLTDFVKISKRAYFYDPQPISPTNARSQLSTSNPSLIVLCTWLGAAPRHILKYTNEYKSRYDGVPIVLLRSELPDMFLITISSSVKTMKPAAQLIKDILARSKQEPSTNRGILLHAMSNGGSSTACNLTQAYDLLASTNGPGSQLPVTAMVMDSAPSFANPKRSHTAMMQSVGRSILIRILAGTFFWIAIFFFRCRDVLGGQNFVLRMRAITNDIDGPLLLNKSKSKNKDNDRDDNKHVTAVPRTYICGKGDALIPMDEVVLHASEARQKLAQVCGDNAGEQIRVEEFVGSRHVGHMMVDPDRYWKIIQETWQRAG